MKQAIIYLILALALSGCVSVGNTPASRFYMLHAADKSQVSEKFEIPPEINIAIGPVKIPEYQNRPQIVTVDKNRMLNFAQFDRWGETLDVGLARVILEDLTTMLPGASIRMFPCNYNIPVKYQVLLDVVQMENKLDQDLVFVAQWSIIQLDPKEMVFSKRSEFHQPINPHDYTGLVEAMSSVCLSLSQEIAGSLVASIGQPKAKEATTK